MPTPDQQQLAKTIEGLKAREVELVRRVKAVQKNRRKAHDPSFPEQATERENDEVLDALDGVERSELAAVRAAIARAESGRFGICDACDVEINPARMEADPSATLCIECAQAQERQAQARQ